MRRLGLSVVLVPTALVSFAVLAACVGPPPAAEGLTGSPPDGGAIWPLPERADAGAQPTPAQSDVDATVSAETDHGDEPAVAPDEPGTPTTVPCDAGMSVAASDPSQPTVPGRQATPSDDGQVLDAGPPEVATPMSPVTSSSDAGNGPAPAAVPAPGEVVITELMPDPTQRTDAEGEWVELWNVSLVTLDLTPCTLGDDESSGSPLPALAIAAGGYRVVARSEFPGFTADGVMPMSLRNTADAIVLRCDGILVDRVAYGPDLGLAVVAGASLTFDPTLEADGSDGADVDNDDPATWCAGTSEFAGDRGTPGAVNDPCEP